MPDKALEVDRYEKDWRIDSAFGVGFQCKGAGALYGRRLC